MWGAPNGHVGKWYFRYLALGDLKGAGFLSVWVLMGLGGCFSPSFSGAVPIHEVTGLLDKELVLG